MSWEAGKRHVLSLMPHHRWPVPATLPVQQTYGSHPKSDKNPDTLEPATTNDHSAKGCNNPLNRGVQERVGNLQGKELSE